MQILVILGPPRSGLNLLSDCLSLLGMTNLAEVDASDSGTPEQINQLLLQDLSRLPTMAGNLPANWLQSPAADKAQARIQTLLDRIVEVKTPLVIAETSLCRVLPLWLSSFRDADIEPRFIHLIRHPWECASSLARTEGIDLFQGHMLWLASHRDALEATDGYPATILTFTQLLTNPISTLSRLAQNLDIHYPLSLHSAYPKLLDFVQAPLNQHHSGQAPEEDKIRFTPFSRLYDTLRIEQFQFLPPKDNPQAATSPTVNFLDTARTALGLLPSTRMTDADPGISVTDLLFDALGLQEQRSQSHCLAISDHTDNSRHTPHLAVEFYLPGATGKHQTIRHHLVPEEWQCYRVPVPRPDLFREQPLYFSPLNSPGLVLISSLKLLNSGTGETIWAAQTPEEFDSLTLEGAALRMPDPHQMTLLVNGKDTRIGLPGVGSQPNLPMHLELSIKASTNESLIAAHLDKTIRNLDRLNRQLGEQSGKIDSLLTAMERAQNQIKDLYAIIDNGNSSNVFQPFNRRLKNEYVRILKNKWAPIFNLELKDNQLRYLAHKICQVENRCCGRLATTIQDALLRVLTALSIKQDQISILEIGSLFGISIASYYECLRGIFPKINITAIDPLHGYYDRNRLDILTGAPVNKTIFDSNLFFNNVPSEDVMLIQDLSTSDTAYQAASKRQYNLIIIDGDHTFEGVKYDFDRYHELVAPGGYVFFDDYDVKDWPGVKQFVDQEVSPHRSFKLTGSEWRSIIFQKVA